MASRRRSNRPTWSLRVWDVLKGCSPKGPSGARQVSSHRWNCEYSRLWDDLPDGGPLNVYPLREIAAEKLRCMIQHLQCRDLFDLYQLVESLGVELADVSGLFECKARANGNERKLMRRLSQSS